MFQFYINFLLSDSNSSIVIAVQFKDEDIFCMVTTFWFTFHESYQHNSCTVFEDIVIHKNCALLGHYVVSGGNFLPKFWGQPIGPIC
jgi:hypothetical protein